MSDIELHLGSITELRLPDNLEEFFKNHGISPDDTYHSDRYTLYYDNDYNPKYIYTKSNRLFVIDDTREEGETDISIISQVGVHKHDYIFQFYNGGTCFSEALIEKLDEFIK